MFISKVYCSSFKLYINTQDVLKVRLHVLDRSCHGGWKRWFIFIYHLPIHPRLFKWTHRLSCALRRQWRWEYVYRPWCPPPHLHHPVNLSVCPQWLQPTDLTAATHHTWWACLCFKTKLTSPSFIHFQRSLLHPSLFFTLQPSEMKGGGAEVGAWGAGAATDRRNRSDKE